MHTSPGCFSHLSHVGVPGYFRFFVFWPPPMPIAISGRARDSCIHLSTATLGCTEAAETLFHKSGSNYRDHWDRSEWICWARVDQCEYSFMNHVAIVRCATHGHAAFFTRQHDIVLWSLWSVCALDIGGQHLNAISSSCWRGWLRLDKFTRLSRARRKPCLSRPARLGTGTTVG